MATPPLADSPLAEVRAHSRLTILLLAMAQGLGMTGQSIIGTTTILVGTSLAWSPKLGTLPLALSFVATMLGTMPAALLMRAIGRRAGFMIGTVIAMVGAALCTWAIFEADFIMLCVGMFIIGIFAAFMQQYRFAAVEAAEDSFKPKAVSYVLAGGVVAGLIGPQLATSAAGMFEPILFAGSYLVMIALHLAAFFTLMFIKVPRLTAAERKSGGRPLSQIIRQPMFIVAAVGAAFGFGIMNLVMVSTPLAITAHDHALPVVGWVISAHIVAMFAPSFITGALIKKFGVLQVMAAGVALYAVCIAVNLSGTNVANFFGGLIALGLGWNFLFVGGTTLLTETYHPTERAKTQGFNDFLIFGTVATTALSSAILYDIFGWLSLNLAVIIPTALIGLALAWGIALKRRAARMAPAE
ncbi:MAG: MFS transporter [Alphaproteobacteria bacterium]